MQDLKVYNFLEKLFGMVGNIRIHPVDFNLPWYSIYKKYWVRLGVSLIVETMVWVFFYYSTFDYKLCNQNSKYNISNIFGTCFYDVIYNGSDSYEKLCFSRSWYYGKCLKFSL